MKEIWTTMASLMGVWAFFQTLLHTILPPHLRHAAARLLQRLSSRFSTHCYYDIIEADGVTTNDLYSAVTFYLSSAAVSAAPRLNLSRPLNATAITLALSDNHRLDDTFAGATVQWEHVVTQRQTQTLSWRPLPEERRAFTLRVHKRDRHLVLGSYLDHITKTAAEIRRRNQDRLLYTNSKGGSLDSRGQPWASVPFKHPSTFETLAIDPDLKSRILTDLEDFKNGEEFYRKTGRAWKRGYLLYGPPGTGKSSMIAAMANYLRYDIYDLELTEVGTNSELRKLLMKTSSKSIIVIEDIDCSITLTNRKKVNEKKKDAADPSARDGGGGMDTITLSGLLNFTDGLWSCCGSERIFVFTTNHVERIDPALLRSGRMDMHIHMSYCTLPALRILLRNYLGVEEFDLAEGEARELEAAEMTPADVSEVLIKNRRDKEGAVEELLRTVRMRTARKEAGKRTEQIEEEEEEKRTVESLAPQICTTVEDDHGKNN